MGSERFCGNVDSDCGLAKKSIADLSEPQKSDTEVNTRILL